MPGSRIDVEGGRRAAIGLRNSAICLQKRLVDRSRAEDENSRSACHRDVENEARAVKRRLKLSERIGAVESLSGRRGRGVDHVSEVIARSGEAGDVYLAELQMRGRHEMWRLGSECLDARGQHSDV